VTNWSLDSYLLTYSMEKSLLEKLTGSAASQEIPRILWNPKVHYCTHKYPATVLAVTVDWFLRPFSAEFQNYLGICLPPIPSGEIVSWILRTVKTEFYIWNVRYVV